MVLSKYKDCKVFRLIRLIVTRFHLGFYIAGRYLMKYLKKIIYNYLFLFTLLSFLWPLNVLGEQSIIPVPTTKLIRDMDLDEIVFFLDQLDESQRNFLVKFLREYDESGRPILEYTRLSPDKYYLNVHKFDSNFIINFSEKYHDMWKIYAVRPHGKNLLTFDKSIVVKNIKTEEDLDYAADPNTIQRYVKKGWLNFQPEGYTSAFISKVFYNSVQNDNLPRGSVIETLGEISLPDVYHLTSNSFSNSWLIDTNFLKKNFPDKIVKTSEGDYEIGFIIEFAHKKLFIKSLAISGFFIFVIIFVNVLKVRNDPISRWLKGT